MDYVQYGFVPSFLKQGQGSMGMFIGSGPWVNFDIDYIPNIYTYNIRSY